MVTTIVSSAFYILSPVLLDTVTTEMTKTSLKGDLLRQRDRKTMSCSYREVQDLTKVVLHMYYVVLRLLCHRRGEASFTNVLY